MSRRETVTEDNKGRGAGVEAEAGRRAGDREDQGAELCRRKNIFKEKEQARMHKFRIETGGRTQFFCFV